jgi:hypothetical protein
MRSRGLPCWKCCGPYPPGGGTRVCDDPSGGNADILRSFCILEIFFY